ncbi:hypothetical protein [Streptosporangium sp. LJ11]|uniref:hypothetical protein n=1 Tax=Streptosporangium sp. LJ11 TaxID=3436927 RepID=UPI003F79CA3D
MSLVLASGAGWAGPTTCHPHRWYMAWAEASGSASSVAYGASCWPRSVARRIARPASEREKPLWTYADNVATAARRLAARYHELRALPIEELVLSGVPLLADVMLENVDVAPV